MEIRGIEKLTHAELERELARGARFVVFEYCISLLILTFKRRSEVWFVPAGQSARGLGLPFSLCSLLLGWWGIPFGPVYTVSTLMTNLRGGLDVTDEVVRTQLAAPNTAAA